MTPVSTPPDLNTLRLSLPRLPSLTPALLGAGLIAGPLFIGASYAQVLTRAGFDLQRHAISMLTLGDLGWIQSANFELTGLLVLACAVGLRRVVRSGRASTWGPRLYGAYGLGLVVAGLFPPDPALGFPPGAPSEMPADMSPHALLHTIGFMVAFASLIGACFVFARRFNGLGWRQWAVYSAATGLAPVPFIALSLALGGSGVPLFVMGVITSAWMAALPLRLLTRHPRLAGRRTVLLT
ncbi:MAG TPA: DUF998 domain-containing protein [Chloroflexota bacterium]|nr:DUF998 domain-containing protein [Chloroflexota bacterium]